MELEFQAYLKSKSREEVKVLDPAISKSKYAPLDLGVGNQELMSIDIGSSEALGNYINNTLFQVRGTVACGGYLEKRGIYNRSEHFYRVEESDDERNIHLGIDLWCNAGTTVHACEDGVIHSFRNNDAFGDYGPTIIVMHNWDGGNWFSLYGHLTKKSIEFLEVGEDIKKGQMIGRLGEPFENGDYPPHLHFQLILDMERNAGDYPGVCSEKEKYKYEQNCPDPNLLLGI